MKNVDLFGIKITSLIGSELEGELKGFLDGNAKVCIGKVNTEFLQRAIDTPEFGKTLEGFDLNIADGVGVQWAAEFLSIPIQNTKYKIQKIAVAVWQMIYTGASLVFLPRKKQMIEKIPGQEAFNIMLKAAEETGAGVYFFGGRENVLAKAMENVKKDFSELVISGYSHGYGDKGEKVVDDINKSGAKMLFVALGSPEQEYWIRDNISKLESVRIAVGEGGTLDFVAGTFRRAPKWMQTVGLEWLWRMFANRNLTTGAGSRFKRVWRAVPMFIYEVVRYKIERNRVSERV